MQNISRTMDRTTIYGLEFQVNKYSYSLDIVTNHEFQARAMCPHQGDEGDISFFVGTQTLKQEANQVHLIRLDEEERVTANIFSHPFGEVWWLNSSPHDKRMLVSCYNQTAPGSPKNQVAMKAAILKTPDEFTEDIMAFEIQELKLPSNADVRAAVFHPSDPDTMAVVSDTKIHITNVDGGGGGGEPRQICDSPSAQNGKFKLGKWALHNQNSQFLALFENSIIAYDVRDMNKIAWTISSQEHVFRDLDCNPHKQCHIVTGSDDGCVKIWDFRHLQKPVFSRNDHSHWVWTVRYNTFHDQLILSSSSDSRVNVTCAYSASSEASAASDNAEANDCLLETLDYHDDSVYCVEWSSADPWTFASLSYDGRFVFRRIAKEIKYKILL